MQFIEMTGATLRRLLRPEELDETALRNAAVGDAAIVRVNQQGDIEVRRVDRWDLVGGLLGDFERRIRQHTGLDWA